MQGRYLFLSSFFNRLLLSDPSFHSPLPSNEQKTHGKRAAIGCGVYIKRMFSRVLKPAAFFSFCHLLIFSPFSRSSLLFFLFFFGFCIGEGGFLPFKVPLDERYDEQVDEQYRWDPAMLLAFAPGRRHFFLAVSASLSLWFTHLVACWSLLFSPSLFSCVCFLHVLQVFS